MQMNSFVKWVVIGGALSGLVGCAGTGKSANKGIASDAYTSQAGIGDVERFYGQDLSREEENALVAKKTIYFDYDEFKVSEEDRLALLAHAKKLLGNKKAHLRLEGHADERGSREYNVALGERRAKSALSILKMKGVSPDQISVVSFGKERPAVAGHEESAWRYNRRAELVYEVE